MDCVWVDTGLITDFPTGKAGVNEVPPDLTGNYAGGTGTPGQYRELIARHGRGINVVMADGSARYMGLGDLYTLNWVKGFHTFAGYPVPNK
jgi:prepilin-type processing-associated H-X9-DG protein